MPLQEENFMKYLSLVALFPMLALAIDRPVSTTPATLCAGKVSVSLNKEITVGGCVGTVGTSSSKADKSK
jgi:hypothetical protein